MVAYEHWVNALPALAKEQVFVSACGAVDFIRRIFAIREGVATEFVVNADAIRCAFELFTNSTAVLSLVNSRSAVRFPVTNPTIGDTSAIPAIK